jgi:transposase InsO family protein
MGHCPRRAGRARCLDHDAWSNKRKSLFCCLTSGQSPPYIRKRRSFGGFGHSQAGRAEELRKVLTAYRIIGKENTSRGTGSTVRERSCAASSPRSPSVSMTIYPLERGQFRCAGVPCPLGLDKAEIIHRRGLWKTREAVELATLEWVSWFNHHRLLEPIGYIPPAEAEANYWRASEKTDAAARPARAAALQEG